jgi:hypothetical protein
MKQIYSRSFTVTFSTGDSGYVLSEKVDPGYILHVHSCFAYAPQREANDDIVIGIRNGGEDVILQAQATVATQLGSVAPLDFFIGEGDQVLAYFPDADDTDKIGIHLNGVLIPLKEWKKIVE